VRDFDRFREEAAYALFLFKLEADFANPIILNGVMRAGPGDPRGEARASADDVVLRMTDVHGISGNILKDVSRHDAVDVVVREADGAAAGEMLETVSMELNVVTIKKFDGSLRQVAQIIVILVPVSVGAKTCVVSQALRSRRAMGIANLEKLPVIVREGDPLETEIVHPV